MEMEQNEIWIWGTGNTAELFQEGIRRWKRKNQIKGYVDNNPDKWGKIFCGKQIISPKELLCKQKTMILLCSNQLETIRAVGNQLNEMGMDWDLLESFVLKDLKTDVEETLQLLEDEKSKELYQYLIDCKMKGEYPKYQSGLLDCSDGYFSLPDFRKRDENEVFVDVGCYIGDTIEEYLRIKEDKFQCIYSFEPDEYSFRKAESNIDLFCEENEIAREKIHIFPYGVGRHTTNGIFVRFPETDGAGSKIVIDETDGVKNNIKIVSLDDFLPDGFSLLKADVESYEYQVLLGAEKSIRKYRPKLAICLYHNTFDFVQIPLLVKQMVPKYRIFIRQHAASWYDTVLYAVV